VKSESDDEQKKQICDAQNQLKKCLPDKLVFYSVPLIFSFAIIVCGCWIFFTHSGLGSFSPATLISKFLLCGAISFFLTSAYYDLRIKIAARRLFRQKNDKSLSKLFMPQLDQDKTHSLRRWMGFQWDWLDENVGSNVPRGMGRGIVCTFANLLYLCVFLAFMAIPPVQDPSYYLAQILFKGVFLIVAVCVQGWLQQRALENLKQTYLFVSKEPNLQYLLKTSSNVQIQNE
jgi:hypothetical protein